MYFNQGSSEKREKPAKSFQLLGQTSLRIMLITQCNQAKNFGPYTAPKVSEQNLIARYWGQSQTY